jgi:LacI family transcriptional regulator
LRHSACMKRSAQHSQCPHVAVCLDQFRSHGRGVMRGIAEYVETYGPWSLFIDPLADSRFPEGRSKNWRGDGILTYIEDAPRADRLRRSGIPTVELFAYRLDGKLPLVATDDLAIGRMAAEHLLERHFRQFAFSGYIGALWSERRKAGFCDTIREAGYPPPAMLLIRRPETLQEWEGVQEQLTAWIGSLPKPAGLMASHDSHALQVLDSCQRAGAAVPEEIAVIGVDNDEETCRLSNPPLTSVTDASQRVGYEGAKLLDQLMAGTLKASDLDPLFLPPSGVVTRRSTDVTAIEDRMIAAAAHHIRENACRGLTVDELARQFGISRSAFYRRFQEALGRSPHHEILRLQLDRVKSLLIQTDLPLEKIAEMSGFSSSNYLNVAFKRENGLTPGAFRLRQNGSARQKS